MTGKKEENKNIAVTGNPENSFPKKLLPKEKELITKEKMKKDTIKEGTNGKNYIIFNWQQYNYFMYLLSILCIQRFFTDI